MQHPNGIWIWDLSQLRTDYLEALTAAQCQRVYLKVLDDASREIFWSWQCTPDIINKFRERGIEVWGWGYIFDQRSSTDVSGVVNAVRRAVGCGVQGFVFDVEQEVEIHSSTHPQLRDILKRSKEFIPPGNMGYTSFGAPEFHPNVPWQMLNELCDLQFPQIYFELFTFGRGATQEEKNWAEVQECLQQHQDLGLNKPILPIWSSESGANTPATKAELQKYLDKYPGSSIWRAPARGETGEAWKCSYSSSLNISDPVIQTPNRRPYQPAPLPLPFMRELKLGDQGEDVYVLICALMELGFLRKVAEATDIFNTIVDGAVRWAQRRNSTTDDGIVGPITKSRFETALHLTRSGGVGSSGGFNGVKFANFCETELSQNIPWSRNIKFIQPFVPDFGNGSWHWCGATVYWLINEFLYKPNGKTMALRYPGMEATFALVEACQQYFQSQGWYQDNRAGYIPPPGAIVIFDWDQTNINEPDQDYDNHIGVFLRMNGDLFVCAEGNTDRYSPQNPNGAPNGRTAIRERERYLIQGFGVIPEGWRPN